MMQTAQLCDMQADTRLLAQFAVTEPEHVADTPIASIWRVKRADGTLACLKRYKDDDLRDEAPGFDLLTAQAGLGAVRIYQRHEAAILMEWLDGPSLGDMARNGDDAGATRILGEVAQRLHSAEYSPPHSLDPLPNRFKALFSATFTPGCPSHVQATVQAARKLAKDLLARQTNIRPLHGDLHHDNVRASARGFLAFDAKGVLGEPTFELANAFRNPLGSDALFSDPAVILRRAAQWSTALNVTRSHMLSWAAAYSALSLSWTHKSVFGPDVAKDMTLIDTFLTLIAQDQDM
ncbi:phosphotransferase [Tateyamaria omphalii]|uniref:aminoglycoside phosphotransferase family protein n=1 Tax=Tateyamaria omphalii TaxID=299262 RepID=UPI001C99729E|nr:aminoglycoside phosphotransferase family protein [Tateyamaria omphalii]MBY5932904.1 phosphotransferase [Tateyamaria omphalii]